MLTNKNKNIIIYKDRCSLKIEQYLESTRKMQSAVNIFLRGP